MPRRSARGRRSPASGGRCCRQTPAGRHPPGPAPSWPASRRSSTRPPVLLLQELGDRVPEIRRRARNRVDLRAQADALFETETVELVELLLEERERRGGETGQL